MSLLVLAIYPDQYATRLALFRDGELLQHIDIRYDKEDIKKFKRLADQKDYRVRSIEVALAKWFEKNGHESIAAIVAPGGILDPVPSGAYLVDSVIVARLEEERPFYHASSLGGILAAALAAPRGISAFVMNPATVDEMDPIAKRTGIPELPKAFRNHALSVKAIVRQVASDLDKGWRDVSLIVAHLGKSFTICAHTKGRMIDLANANDLGPFSPTRSGGVPAADLVRMAFSGAYARRELRKKITGRGGMVAYLGTSDLEEVRRRIDEGDDKFELVLAAMAYQVAQEIGALATSLCGNVDAIALTGGCVCDAPFAALVAEQVQWIAPVLLYPGEDELAYLAQGAYRILKGEEKPRRYAEVMSATA